jgi:hypothetical protein
LGDTGRGAVASPAALASPMIPESSQEQANMSQVTGILGSWDLFKGHLLDQKAAGVSFQSRRPERRRTAWPLRLVAASRPV